MFLELERGAKDRKQRASEPCFRDLKFEYIWSNEKQLESQLVSEPKPFC